MNQQLSNFFGISKSRPLSIIHELIRELKVSRMMTTDVKTLPTNVSMRAVRDLMRFHQISGVPIVDQGYLKGIVSVEDLIRAMNHKDLDASITRYMTRELITTHPEEPAHEALKKLEQTGVGRLVVVREPGKLAGMLTKGDIVAGLLHALEGIYHELERSEDSRSASGFFEALFSDETSLFLRYSVPAGDFTVGGSASSQIKKALLQIGASSNLARRVSIATYEAEINLIIHTTEGGQIVAEIRPDIVTVVAYDAGPGIPDVQLAMQPGYSTASEEAREMGFGAGMGLVNMERCADEMNIWSAVDVGTRVEMLFDVPNGE
jgi:CBS domain-containing protein/anti-sigma regulatory factor (Ser/Thr protein kinase)